MRMAAHTKQHKDNEEESASLTALMMEGTVFLTSAWNWTQLARLMMFCRS